MRVFEVAREFKIGADQLLTLLRGMGVQVRSEASAVEDSVVARLRARMERERRSGHTDETGAIEAVMEDAQVAIAKPLYEDAGFASFRCRDPDGYAIEFYWEGTAP